MNEVRRKTIEHVPTGHLPADMREGLAPNALLTVTIVEEVAERSDSSEKLPKYLRYWGIAAHKNTSIAEAVTRIRKLRDEWD